MKRFLSAAAVAAVAAVVISGALYAVPMGALDQFADANTRKKVHFTETLTSSADPGMPGADLVSEQPQQQQGERHIAFVLSPNPGTIYDGSMTFASSAPVDVMILHAITSEDIQDAADYGLPVWTVDGQTRYAASVIGTGAGAASVEFTGAAVALYGKDRFAATVSVDGWVRGEPTPVVMQTISVETPPGDPHLPLSRTSVPAVIPMHEGMYEGDPLLYIITDAGDADYAAEISEAQGWRVQHSPVLALPPDSPAAPLPESVLQQVYVFTNGIEGDGLYGYQTEVFSSTPAEAGYSALSEVIKVAWKPGQNEITLESVDDILREEEAGRVSLGDDVVIVNMPQVRWPGDGTSTGSSGGGGGNTDGGKYQRHDQAAVRVDADFSGQMPYGGGQITEIDTENMTVTFVAHRGWGPDGRTTYHIVTGATPERPAGIIGVESVPAYAGLVDHAAAADLYVFENGVTGSGSLGFQAPIFGAEPGWQNGTAYTPLWRVHTVEWNDPAHATVLENVADIESFRDEGMLTAGLARPTNSYYVINAPLVDPFQ